MDHNKEYREAVTCQNGMSYSLQVSVETDKLNNDYDTVSLVTDQGYKASREDPNTARTSSIRFSFAELTELHRRIGMCLGDWKEETRNGKN